MAEEVKIVDVAGGPAAEATLQEILKLMRQKGGGGGGTGSAAKAQELYTTAVTRGTTVRQQNTKEVKKSTEALGSFTSGLTKGIGGAFSALGSVLMGATGLVTNFGNSLANANTIGELVEAVPIFGSMLGKVTGYFDESLSTFQQLSQVGAGFGNDMMAMRSAAAQSGLSLQQFAEVIGNNSQNMGLLGGTTSEGAKRFGRLTRTLRQSEAGLTRLGMTQQDVNEGFNEYIEMMASSGQLRGRSDRELTAGAANYLTEIDKLARVTGKSRKELQEEMNQRMDAANFNIMASKLSGEALTNFTNNTQFTSDMMGSDFANALTDMADGVSQSPFAQVLESNVPGLKALAEANATGKISQEEYQSRLQALMPQITAFADGMGEAGATQLAGVEGFDSMMAAVGRARTFTQRYANAQEAAAAQARRAPLTESYAGFAQKIAEIRTTIEEALLESGVLELLGNVLAGTSDTLLASGKAIAEAFKQILGDGDVKTGIASFNEKIKSATATIVKWIREFADGTMKQKLDEFTAGIKNAWTAVSDFITKIKETSFSEAVASLFGGVDGQGIGDLISQKLSDGIKSIWENHSGKIVGAITALFLGPKIIGALTGGIGKMFGGLFGGGGGGRAPGGVRGPSGAGKAGKGVGDFVGNVGGGVLKGVAKGLAAFGNPQVAIGGAVLAGVILVIGAAVAGATWLVGKSLPTFAEGMKAFEDLDGTRLSAAGKGMLAVAGGMAAFGAGSAVAGIGNAVGAIGDAVAGLFGGEDPMDKILRFQEYNFDAARIENNANAVVAFSKAMAAQGAGAAASGMGGAVGAIGDAIAGFFGGDTGIPYNDILDFQTYSFDVEKVRANATAMAVFNKALVESGAASAASGAGGAIGAIGDAISSFFGGETPFEKVQNFGNMDINAEGVKVNAQAMADMANALNAFSGGEASEIEISSRTVTSLTRLSELGATTGLGTLATDLNRVATVQGLSANISSLNSLDADGVTLYNTAMEKLVDTLEDLNKVLAEDNSGTFGGGTGVSAASMLENGQLNTGGSGTGSAEQLERLNMLVTQLVSLQGEGNRNTRQTVAAITNNLQAGIG
jgi:hypothetical protein